MSAVSENKGKIGLVVVLLLVAGAVYWFTAPSRPKLSNTILYVDVSTGKLYDLPRGTTRVPPVANPDTGTATMLPCYRDESGQVFVSRHMRTVLKDLGELNQFVDSETLQVKSNP